MKSSKQIKDFVGDRKGSFFLNVRVGGYQEPETFKLCKLHYSENPVR